MKSDLSSSSTGAYIDAHHKEFEKLAEYIWEHPEETYHEEKTWLLHRDFLAERGFKITVCPEMPHSFIAETGRGKPVIALMGEFDALPGMSQECSCVKKPRVDGAPGHACGHNLLGVGSLAAVCALADAAKQLGLTGTIRYYGCPSEEGLGRVNLVKAGRFNDVDVALTWHPADVNTPHRYTTNANLALNFRFKGRASHAGMAPQAGRSALDAVQLMNMGIEFLREHVDKGIMLHYVITNGGLRPNIVPADAAMALYIRAPSAEQVRSTFKRVLKIAKGASLMTETSFEWDATHGKCDYRPNDVIQDELLSVMKAIPLPVYSAAEEKFAAELAATMDKKSRSASLVMIGAPISLLKDSIHREVADFGKGYRIGGSLDVGDVSYVAPTGQMNAAVWPLGVGAHSWQSCAASGSSFARKGMLYAGKVLAGTGLAFLSDAKLAAAARAEWRKDKKPYRSTMD